MVQRRRPKRTKRDCAELNNTKAKLGSRAKMKTMIEKSMRIWEIIPLPCPNPTINVELTTSPPVSRKSFPIAIEGIQSTNFQLV
jgi:hypothetical protein